jgi:hypothetical protein
MAALVQLVEFAPAPTNHVLVWAEVEEMASRELPAAKRERKGNFFGFTVGLLDRMIVFQGQP